MAGDVAKYSTLGDKVQRLITHILEFVPLRLLKLSATGLTVEPNVSIKSPERLELGNNVTIQRNTIIHCGGKKWCDFKGKVVLADHVVIGPDCILYGAGEMILEACTHLGPKVIIMTQSGKPNENRMTPHPDHIFEPVHIGKGCWIGAGAVILGGTVLGDGCTVGPNAVVKGEYPDNSVLIGNPARVSTPIKSKQ
jgi:acetyltransferase-like isoleucine patch superfamily enzyme